MAPLVLHNVPDEELFTGLDGVTRPFAIVGASDERRSARLRRQATATQGPFGRTRSRQRAGSVGPASERRRQQTPGAVASSMATPADEVFGTWKRNQELLYEIQHADHQHARKSGDEAATAADKKDLLEPGDGRRPKTLRNLSGSSSGTFADEVPMGIIKKISSNNDADADDDDDADETSPKSKTPPQNQPIEVVLRGFRSTEQQYAALWHYEQIAGRICEDYPREPPVGSRRYRTSLRDAAARSAANPAGPGIQPLTPAERKAVMRAASGQHWVKVTFESAQAADAALYASPQSILGYLVSAELYHGMPLSAAEDVAVPDPDAMAAEHERARHGGGSRAFGSGGRRSVASSSRTAESGTVTHDDDTTATTTAAATAGLVRDPQGSSSRGRARNERWDTAVGAFGADDEIEAETTKPAGAAEAASSGTEDNATFCRRIPTARRATLRAPEQALLPRESAVRRVVKRLPLLHRLTGTIIGNQVPRKEDGQFDWEKASLYWRLIWWLDFLFSLFSGEILDASKDD